MFTSKCAFDKISTDFFQIVYLYVTLSHKKTDNQNISQLPVEDLYTPHQNALPFSNPHIVMFA